MISSRPRVDRERDIETESCDRAKCCRRRLHDDVLLSNDAQIVLRADYYFTSNFAHRARARARPPPPAAPNVWHGPHIWRFVYLHALRLFAQTMPVLRMTLSK